VLTSVLSYKAGFPYSPSHPKRVLITNTVPLWEFELKEGRIRFTHPVDHPLPVQAYLSLIGKYKHLDEKQIAFIQEQTNRKIGVLKNFAREEKKEPVPNAA
jgi:hypothetical protein